jgi:hypothetical protein
MMNKVIREHYPAAKLPEELRAGIDPNASVKITVEIEEPPQRVMSLEEMFELRRDVFPSQRDIDDHVKTLRDEWDA